MDTIAANARDLEIELDWFAVVLGRTLVSYFETPDARPDSIECPPPPLGDSPYAQFVNDHALSATERLVLVLALVPHVRPQLLDIFWTRNSAIERGYSEFGGLQGTAHGGFIPTGETAAFIVAGENLELRFGLNRLFDSDHVFAREGVLRLVQPAASEPMLSGVLSISAEYLHRFTSGDERKPTFGSDFPARRIDTQATWKDLVLPIA
ncbi:MAG: ATP-binding protein, partial [Gemmatimonadaceae bacterium]